MAVKLGKQPRRFLKNLPANLRKLVLDHLHDLSKNERNVNVKVLKGKKRVYYRFRIGKIRVIYIKKNGDFYVMKIGFRGDIY